MRHLDLFSGIGGFSLAGQWAWGDEHEIVEFIEKDKHCQRVLNKHWPNVLIWGDIKTYDAKKHRGTIDIITGGFPCQPTSLAGKRRGQDDDRWLWPEMLRVISEVRPPWVIGENVAGFVSMGLDEAASDLENQGYEVECLIIPACGVNAPHRRDRVWIVAYSERNGLQRERSDRSIERPIRLCGGEGSDKEQVIFPYSESERFRRGNMPDNSGDKSEDQQGGEKIRSEISGYLRQWETEPTICRVADGVSNRVDRLKGLGNSIVPQVAFLIMKGIEP